MQMIRIKLVIQHRAYVAA